MLLRSFDDDTMVQRTHIQTRVCRTIFMNFTNQISHFNIYSMRFIRNGGAFYYPSTLVLILMLGKFHLHTFGRFAWIASDGCAPCKTSKYPELENNGWNTRTPATKIKLEMQIHCHVHNMQVWRKSASTALTIKNDSKIILFDCKNSNVDFNVSSN